jgi:hypothetical protein
MTPGTWWKGQVQNTASATVTTLGRIHVPWKNAATTPMNFIEYYGEATGCDQTPFNDAFFGPPTNYGWLLSRSPTTYAGRAQINCVVASAGPIFGGAWARSGGPKPWIVPTPTLRAGASSVTAAWRAPMSDGGAAVSGYTVQISTDKVNWATAATVPATTASTVLNGLTPGRAHYVRVAATNAAGLGAWSFSSAVATPSTGANPVGAVEVVSGGPGAVYVAGWAADADSTGPVSVRVTAGTQTVTLTADQARSDIAAAFPALGPNRGFSGQLAGLTGTVKVCAVAVNRGLGADSDLGCRDVAIASGSPFGNLEAAVGGPDRTLTVSGWAIDPDVVDPVTVRVSVNGTVRTITANADRADIATAYPLYGAGHGFATTVTGLAAGDASVCVTLVNIASGANVAWPCRTVKLPGGDPFGSVESITAGPDGRISASGWASDPDTAASIPVHIYVGSAGAATTADLVRADVGQAYPGYGDTHGYSWTRTGLARGSYQVCVYGINVGVGANSLLGCRTVSIA